MPLDLRIATAIALGVWFTVDMLIEELRQLRARRRAREAPPHPYGGKEWIQCDELYFLPFFGADPFCGGLRGECHQEKDHAGPHEACVSVEWSR